MKNNNPIKISEILKAKNILNGKIVTTPLIYDFYLSKKFGSKIFYKAENIQRTGSFKIRGAYNKIYNSIKNDKPAGILAWSSGNHAQGVAEAANIFNIKSTIVMPKDAPQNKINGTKSRNQINCISNFRAGSINGVCTNCRSCISYAVKNKRDGFCCGARSSGNCD